MYISIHIVKHSNIYVQLKLNESNGKFLQIEYIGDTMEEYVYGDAVCSMSFLVGS